MQAQIQETTKTQITDYELVRRYHENNDESVIVTLWNKYSKGLSHKLHISKVDSAYDFEDYAQEIYFAVWKAVKYIKIKNIKCNPENFNFHSILKNYVNSEVRSIKKRGMALNTSSLTHYQIEGSGVELIDIPIAARPDASYHQERIWEETKVEFAKILTRKQKAIFKGINRHEQKTKLAKRLKLSNAMLTYNIRKIDKMLKEFITKKLDMEVL